jgi:alcohol dehydrogenase class IV
VNTLDGETSCLTLGPVVIFKAKSSQEDAEQISRLLSITGGRPTGNGEDDAVEVGQRIISLVEALGLHPPTLTERGIGKEQIPIIVQRATGDMKEGPLHDSITDFVEKLY